MQIADSRMPPVSLAMAESDEARAPADPRLDFFSDTFDALVALKTLGVRAPVADAKSHDNLQMYQSAWSGRAAQVRKKAREGKEGEGGKEEGRTVVRRWLPHQCKWDGDADGGRGKSEVVPRDVCAIVVDKMLDNRCCVLQIFMQSWATIK